MPRKSQAIRLAQSIQTLEAFKAAGYMSHESKLTFIQDMIRRLKRGKTLSKRQRDWLDNIIEEGVPEPKGDVEYIAKIDEALNTEGVLQEDREVLISFRGKTIRGWDLSEKQLAWCNKIIKKAEHLRVGDYWKPDQPTTERIRLAVSCEICYSSAYWGTHPGGARALSRAKAWINGNTASIDEWTVTKLFKAVSGRLRDLENPKFSAGDLIYVARNPGVVVSGPVPLPVGVCYDILVDGRIDRIHVNRIYKTLRKKGNV